MIDLLFPSRRAAMPPKKRIRGRSTTRRSLDVQRLEERLALAIGVFQYPMNAVDTSLNNYAVLVLDQGDAGFLKKNATPSPSFTYANNSQFLDDGGTLTALNVGAKFTDIGDLTTFYVTSGQVIMGGMPLTDPGVGTVMVFDNTSTNEIDIGTNDGIVPGTFWATLTVTDDSGNTETGDVFASSPGAQWNLNFSNDLGSLKPSRGSISERDGNIRLEWATAPANVTLTPITWAVYTGPPDDVAPLSFTVSPGQTLTQSMRVDLTRVTSTVTINSPVLAETGPGSTAQFFRPAGSVAIAADTIVVNANTSSSSIFTAQAANLTVNRPVAAPLQSVEITGTPAVPGRIFVSEQGALAGSVTSPATNSAGSLALQATHADVVFAGIINAAEQTYLLQSPLDPRAYTMTTASPSSGVQAGRILGDTVGITLANDAGGEVNLRTSVDTLRMTASSTPSAPALPYAITIAESDNLTIDAVPASRRPIVVDASGTLTLASSVQTVGDLTLSARNQLALVGAISSAAGSITLVSDGIAASGPITAGGTRGVALQSRSATGDIVLGGLVRAGGTVKAPVRAATTAAVDLSKGGLLTIDGVALAKDDRVLVKNQLNPAENGIYVADTGVWSRAVDANTAQLLAPGFTVAVLEGTQEGAWAFANASNPTLEQTGLSFVPASAAQVYVPVTVATTATDGNINLSVGGLLTIDGVTLVDGDRVLVKNQANTRQNGIYVVAGTSAWVRASDADTVPELIAGSYVFVTAGATNAGKGFVLKDDAVQVGITPLVFEDFAVQATRSNAYSPANVLATVVAATTVHIDLAAPPAEIDGIDLADGDLVLVKNQFDAAANGIYVYAAGGLTRWAGADSASELARGTIVFVARGATNAGSSWTFNDKVDMVGRTTAGSLQVTGLSSTQYLASGMLVSGPGIPSNTKIDIVIDGTSARLTKAALASSTSAVLGFMQTSAVAVGSTPLLFVPTGGTVAVTAGRSITSGTTSPTSRITASTTLLTAGLPQTGPADAASLVDVNSAVGRLSAAAPASVTVSDSGALDLFDVRTAGGGVTVDAQGTITARSVAAAGGATSPADVRLTSLYGDVVAAAVSSAAGTIDLVSTNERVVVCRLGLTTASVQARDGDVAMLADVGGIWIEGAVRAGGADGDVTAQSTQGALVLVAPATIQASDRLTITTPNAIPTLGTGTTVTAAALSITSQFGPGATAPPAGFGTYSTLNVNRTDAGVIDMSSSSALDIEGASTVNGSILFTAPSISVVGPVTAGTEAVGDGNISLTATTGGITLSGELTAQSDTIKLAAPAGTITQTGGAITAGVLDWTAKMPPTFTNVVVSAIGANLTSPGDLALGTAGQPITVASASTVGGGISIIGSNVTITGLVSAGGSAKSVSVNAGNTLLFKDAGRIVNADNAGTAALTSAGPISATNTGTWTTVTAGGSLTITAGGATSLSTDVTTLEAAVTGGGLTVTEKNGLSITSISASGQPISLTVGGPLSQTGAIIGSSMAITSTAGAVTLTNSGNNVATISGSAASGGFSFDDADGFTVGASGITAGTSTAGDGNVDLTALTGDIVIAADLTAANDTIKLAAPAGTITQTGGAITAGVLDWTAKMPPTFTNVVVSAIGANLTGPGDLALGTAGQPITVASASTVGGGISIIGSNVTITGLVSAGGSAKSVSVNAGNTLLFKDAGRIVNADNAGTAALTSAGPISATNTGTGTTVTAGGSLTITAGGATSLSTDVTTLGAAVTGGGLTVTEKNGLSITSISASGQPISLTVGGPLSQTGAIIGSSMAITSTAGAVTLTNAGNDIGIGTLSIANGDRAVSFTDKNALVIGAAGLTGGAVAISLGGNLTQSGAVTSSSLDVTNSAGAVTLTNATNDVGTLSVANGNRAVSFTDKNSLGIGAAGLTGGAIVLLLGGNLTQSGAIAGASLDVTNSAGTVTLTNAANDVGTVTVANGSRAVSFTDKNTLDIGATGLTGGAIVLSLGGNLTQSGAIAGASLDVTNSAGTVTLTNAANDIDTLTVTNGNRAVAFTDTDAFAIGATGLIGGAMSLVIGGTLTQAGAIIGSSLAITSSVGVITLNNPANDVDTLTVANGNRAVAFTDADALAIGSTGLVGGAMSLVTGGSLTQAGAVIGSSLAIASSVGVIALNNPANDIDTLSVANDNRAVAFTDADALSIGATGLVGGTISLVTGGTLSVDTSIVGSTVTLTTSAGGGVDVGPLTDGLLKSTGTLDLQNVQGPISIRNNGRIEGSPVLLPAGRGIQVGGPVSSVDDLNQAVDLVNSLPVIPGGRYEILVAANMTLTQTLTFTVPVSLSGTSQTIVLSGSTTVRTGLALGATASGSLVRNIAFANFADTAIRLTNNTGTSITGVIMRDCGTGLTVNGTSTGATVRSNTFNRCATGIRLNSATGITIGGSAAGQGNTIANASQQGVFAQGFCTNSRLVKNNFPGTRTPYNVKLSRNLTIVR